MNWKKLGNVFAPNGEYEWMQSHAANPFAYPLNDRGIFRTFFTCRNQQNNSHIAWVDLDFENDFKVVNLSKEPVLSPGDIGLFDDSGVALGYILDIQDKQYMYYLGWNLKVTVPWLNTIGLAEGSVQAGKFSKTSKAPLMDRSNEDPYSISYPSVLKDGNIYRMYYGSNLNWGNDQSMMNHVIKYAESTDGLNWKRTNKIVIDLKYENEYALSKPFVIKDQGLYRMWYSYRGRNKITTYRIGYAESVDGFEWVRKDDEVGIDVSESGWDSEMIEYPQVIKYKNETYMLYNGNAYGKTGFGIAKLEK